MLVTRGLAPHCLGPLALTIGNFDGVHRGHQAMLARVVATARAQNLNPAALIFEPQPREHFAPQSAPTRLTALREKLELLQAHGIDQVHVQRFSRAFATLSPETFVKQLLVDALQTRWLLVGEDFRYGAHRTGDLASLNEAAKRFGFQVEAMPTIRSNGARISSSAVREALANGDLRSAEVLLGRPYSMSGRVVHGLKLGRQLGFATANVQMKHNRPPLNGIFAVRVHGADDNALPGVASLGVRPTVATNGRSTLEVHLFDFARDIYGRHLKIEFLAKIRDEEKYPDLETLKTQIARDCEAARTVLKNY